MTNNIAVVTFTCKRDFERAAFHAAALPKDWMIFWIVESFEEREAARAFLSGKILSLPHVSVQVFPFDRGKSLRGDAAVCGMCNVFRTVFSFYPYTDVFIKLDSDTHLFEPEAFTEPILKSGCDFVYIRRLNVESRLLANGCCYAMSPRAVRRLSMLKPPFPENYGGHEDLIFSSFFTTQQRDLALCQINKLRWSWCEQPFISGDCLGAHNGYVSLDEDRRIVDEIYKAKRK